MTLTFGEYIKKLRTDKGLTLTQLAAKLDLDSANLSKIENNKRVFDEKRLSKLAEIFGISLNEVREEFLADQLGKKIYQINDTSKFLCVVEEKAEYYKSINAEKQITKNNIPYVQLHLRNYLLKQKALNLSYVEDQCGLKKNTIKRFLKGEGLTEKAYNALSAFLNSYGFTALGDE